MQRRKTSECGTPLLVNKIDKSEYFPEPYAVKIVRSDDEEKIMAHVKEFEILRKLDHTNVVKAIEMFEDKAKHHIYQVIEFIDGQEILDEIA